MDTATIAAISVGGIALILFGMLIATLLRPRFYPAGQPIDNALDYLTFLNWFKVLYYFIPYGLFLFGIIYDGLVEKIKFFPAGFIGLLAVYINSWIAFAFRGNTLDSDICGVPGLSKWGSDISPQNIVFTSTVMGYIASYITNKRGTIEIMSTGAAWIAFVAVWLVQTWIYNLTGCPTTKTWRTFGPVQIVPPILAMIFGGGIGSLFGWVFSTYVSVGTGISPEQQQALLGGGKSGPAMAPTTDTVGAGKCSPTDSDDAFVCEAYKNGELVTSTIVE